jgi:hypothetical protein
VSANDDREWRVGLSTTAPMATGRSGSVCGRGAGARQKKVVAFIGSARHAVKPQEARRGVRTRGDERGVQADDRWVARAGPSEAQGERVILYARARAPRLAWGARCIGSVASGRGSGQRGPNVEEAEATRGAVGMGAGRQRRALERLQRFGTPVNTRSTARYSKNLNRSASKGE